MSGRHGSTRGSVIRSPAMAGAVSRRRTRAASGFRVHLLDVGQEEYGDAVLVEVAGKTVLVDGAHPGDDVGDERHPGIPQQLGRLLGATRPPYTVDLLIVSHAHDDHIGCLPKHVGDGTLQARWALEKKQKTDPWDRRSRPKAVVVSDKEGRIIGRQG